MHFGRSSFRLFQQTFGKYSRSTELETGLLVHLLPCHQNHHQHGSQHTPSDPLNKQKRKGKDFFFVSHIFGLFQIAVVFSLGQT